MSVWYSKNKFLHFFTSILLSSSLLLQCLITVWTPLWKHTAPSQCYILVSVCCLPAEPTSWLHYWYLLSERLCRLLQPCQVIECFRGQISKAIPEHKTDMCVVFIKVGEGFEVDLLSFASQLVILGAALL